MAKATYTCAGCGADVQCIARTRSEADRLAAWNEKNKRLCGACFSAQRQAAVAAENEASAAHAAASGLPALTGSEKQVPWAVTLREKLLQRFTPAEDKARALLSGAAVNPFEDAADAAQRLLIAGEILRAKTSAHWWIDQRLADPRTLVCSVLKPEIDAELQRRAIAAQTPAEIEAETAAMEEALLRPPGDAVSPHVVEVALNAAVLTARVDAYIPELRTPLVECGLAWDEKARHWRRTLPAATTGDPVDRLAEVADRLLSASFLVRVHNPEARRRVVAGEFSPEVRRWITLAVSAGKFKGWYGIRWPKGDDLYDDARRIAGSRYKDGWVYAPPGATDEVMDFAERYGFSISTGAQDLAAQHRAALAAGVVVLAKGKTDTSIRVGSPDGVPPVLAMPSSVAIDDDLLDA